MILSRIKQIGLYLCLLQFALCSTSPNACNCIPIKDCAPFSRLLLHHKPEASAAVFAVVHAAACGFDGLEPLACCPNFYYNYPDESSPASRMLRFAPPPEQWVWDRRNSAAAETSLLDYRDFKTQRNWPRPVGYDFDGQHFGPFHEFRYNVEHGNEPEPIDYFRPKQPRVVAEDRPIVFPGDLRFQSAIQKKTEFPTKVVATNINRNKKVKGTTPRPALQTSSARPRNAPGCGISLTMRILGGQQTSPGQYPWLARIAYRNMTNNRISYRCSGSLISNNYILTAAHCVVNLVNDLELSHVRIGDHTNVDQDCAPMTTNCRDPNLFAINRLVVHPSYDQPKYSNDIALLRINNTERNFTAICLPLNSTATLADRLIGQFGVAAGWSTTIAESSDSSVRVIRLPIVNTTSCAISYANLSENFQDPIIITPNHLCAQGQPMNDVCRGDSGGPFMDDGTSGLISRDGRHTLLGIVAFGPTVCGITTVPGVYTRVSSYVDWILNSSSSR